MLENTRLKVVAVLAICSLLGGAWWLTGELGVRPVLSREIDEVRQIAENNQRRLDADRWFELDKKRAAVGLTQSERIEWCELGKRLGYLDDCRV